MSKDGERNYYMKLGEDGIRHSINKPFSYVTLGEFLMVIGSVMSLLPSPPAKIIDLGCGVGWTCIFFAKNGYQVTEVDISDHSISLAREQKKIEKLNNLNF